MAFPVGYSIILERGSPFFMNYIGVSMNLRKAGLAAKSIGYITFAFDKTASLLGKIGRRGYQAVIDKPKYSIDIYTGDTQIQYKENVTAKQINEVMRSMKTIDNLSVIVRKYEK
tara:strand:- start:406 stop:747 length:342 start_codon:yes stop_codon:yes gene_type:complete